MPAPSGQAKGRYRVPEIPVPTTQTGSTDRSYLPIRENSGRASVLATWSRSGFHPHRLDSSTLAPTISAATFPS